ncbi:MAG: peptidoglycan DD-metalloendopeptidase family protein [Actinomycetota bacterium]|nr:peptidoglycan DD-metalloendopeptidase family protein [Actinomycetota bacterium]
MPLRAFLGLLALAAALSFPAGSYAAGSARVAALQVALKARGLYGGPVDGYSGPGTRRAILRFQRHRHLAVDGVVGPHTRRALGRLGRHPLGTRPLGPGAVGWDVTALQFLLAWHGFPSGALDGHLAGHTDHALRRFQRWAGLAPDGVAGPGVLRALRQPRPRCPIALVWPLRAPLGDLFGPRGNRFHAGIDLPAPTGTPVLSAAAGRAAFVGWADGWGRLVVVQHASGVRTLYAHLSTALVRRGQSVLAGSPVGGVGATGEATGPHLHFEVHVRGAAVDPLRSL